MNKAQLIEVVARKTGVSQAKAGESVNAVLEAFSEALDQEGAIQLVGFGSLTVETRAERNGRNPKTGESMVIPSSKYVKFTAGKALKERVNR
jgi:DNA-binding protein HU-beta